MWCASSGKIQDNRRYARLALSLYEVSDLSLSCLRNMQGRAALLVASAALAALIQPADALYFYVTDGQQRCFIEEVPAETLIVGTYKNPDFVPFGRPDFTGVVSGS